MQATTNTDAPAVRSGETFQGTWPYRARYCDAAGFPMHYVDEGSGSETLLLLHGEPTWSYLFRHQISDWAATQPHDRGGPHGIREERGTARSNLLASGPRRQSRKPHPNAGPPQRHARHARFRRTHRNGRGDPSP